jgi:hypothetical protein
MKTDDTNKADCLQCIHYAVTWEPKLPRSCKLFGFKSANMPSATVLSSTGSVCMGFAKRNDKKNKPE